MTLSGENSIALVHDYLLTMRGAERSFAAIADCWPEAPIYSSMFDERVMGARFTGHEVHTTWLQYIGADQRHFRKFLPLYPAAFERMDVSAFDVIVSSSSAFAHGVMPRADAVHVCYCYTPFRYVWHERKRALEEFPPRLRPAAATLLNRIRKWDIEASKRVTHYVGISEISRDRIKQSYGRDAAIIYPPVDVARFGAPVAPDDFFLMIGEVVSHKRFEVAIEATARVGGHIKIVGDGPDRYTLSKKYPGVAEFVGRVSDSEVEDLLATCKALVVPNVEEFGIAAVEAQASGRPVLATGMGGTGETIIDGETGVLVQNGSLSEFEAAMRDTNFEKFDPERIAAHAQKFSEERFKRELQDFVERAAQ